MHDELLGLLAYADDLLAGRDVDAIGGDPRRRWILGHIAACRRETIRLLDPTLPVLPWEMGFHAGGRPGPDPAVADLLRHAAELGVVLRARIAAMDDRPRDDLAWCPAGATPRAFMVFRIAHECYHIGQLPPASRDQAAG